MLLSPAFYTTLKSASYFVHANFLYKHVTDVGPMIFRFKKWHFPFVTFTNYDLLPHFVDISVSEAYAIIHRSQKHSTSKEHTVLHMYEPSFNVFIEVQHDKFFSVFFSETFSAVI